MVKKPSERKTRRRIYYVIYAFSLLFFGMIFYLIYFVGFQASELMGNPYNARMDLFNRQILRGSILDSRGNVLARTEVAEDGTERRVYPYRDLFAHAVGYSQKGKTGLEAYGNFYLMENNGNPFLKIRNELMEEKSRGDNIISSLNLELQMAASNALGKKRGAVLLSELSTGRILVMVSKPGYDPNTIVENWEKLTDPDNGEGNLLNRATQGLYPPGSTFKSVMVLAYMREHPNDWQNFSFDCHGSYQDPSDPSLVVHCYQDEKHGAENLEEAYQHSCNSAFAYLGTQTDKTKLRKLAEELYFNNSLPYALLYNKSRFSVDQSSDVWSMMQTSIGQGMTLMSPLHNLLLTEAIANGGTYRAPELIDSLQSYDGHIVKRFGKGEEKRLLRAEEAEVLRQMMRKVVTDGTASALKSAEYHPAGKTGSAEYQEEGKTKTNAWFVGFAPYEDPKVAVTVIVEEGATGGRTAAPIARAVLDEYFAMNSK